jgi:hypothetical protein
MRFRIAGFRGHQSAFLEHHRDLDGRIRVPVVVVGTSKRSAALADGEDEEAAADVVGQVNRHQCLSTRSSAVSATDIDIITGTSSLKLEFSCVL